MGERAILLSVNSLRAEDYAAFSKKVVSHIDNYTVPQYGDRSNDNVEDWTSEDCFKQVEKYLKRRNSSQREGEKELDILKAAHYLQLGFSKLSIDQ